MAIEKNSPVCSCFRESHSPVHLQTFLLPWLLALNAVYAPKTTLRIMVSTIDQTSQQILCVPWYPYIFPAISPGIAIIISAGPRHQTPLYVALMSRQCELRAQLPPRILFTR